MQFLGARESICVRRPTKSTEDPEEKDVAGSMGSIEEVDFTGAKF